MTSSLIQQYLPADIHDIAARFTIPEDFIASMPDLIELVLRSKSMDKDADKQSWFNLLPMMNDEQIAKLKDILMREKQKLAEIEEKYKEKKTAIRDKYVQTFQAADYTKKMQVMKSQEEAHKEKDAAEADSLLDQL